MDDTSPYGDVAASDDHAASITRLKDLGVIAGTECDGDNFCPNDPIDRKTLAVWLVRVLQGEDAPDFTDGGGEDPALLAMLTSEQITALTPRFEDVPFDHPHYNFIEQMAELKITGGCSKEPAKFCPDNRVSRSHMAAFFARALDLDEPRYPPRFVDVDSDSFSHKNISRLTTTTIDPGCGYPSRFCPNDSVSRAQMANLLARVIDRQEALDEVAVTGSDDSIELTVAYDEEDYEATVRWRKPSSKKGQVDHYILQSRLILEDFGPKSYQIIEPQSGKTKYRINLSNISNTNHFYAFRVIVVYTDGKRLATSEVKTPSESHQLRDAIFDLVVEPNQKEHPWLLPTWIHMNNNTGARLKVGGSVAYSSEYPYPYGLKRKYASSIGAGSIHKNQGTNYTATTIEEMGHVYTDTGNIDDNSAAVGIGYLYLNLLEFNHVAEAKKPSRCYSGELYGDMAKLAFWGRYSDFDANRGLRNVGWDGVSMSEWSSCGFNIDPSTKARVDRDIPAIAKSVFVDQEIPQWFYDTYQNPDESIDLEKLWSDINTDSSYKTTIEIIAYHLRNEFGGYCSQEEVRKFIEGKATGITNPWKDGGCKDNVVIEERHRKPRPIGNESNPDLQARVDELIRHGSYGSYPLSLLQLLGSSLDSCWIAVNGYVFDVTPGDGGYEYTGPGQLSDICGQDASQHFASNDLSLPNPRHLRGALSS